MENSAVNDDQGIPFLKVEHIAFCKEVRIGCSRFQLSRTYTDHSQNTSGCCSTVCDPPEFTPGMLFRHCDRKIRRFLLALLMNVVSVGLRRARGSLIAGFP